MTINKPSTKFVISNRIYERYCQQFDLMDLKANEYSPSIEVIQRDIIPNLEENIVFLMWIDETGFDTDSNRDSRAVVRDILKSCLTITD